MRGGKDKFCPMHIRSSISSNALESIVFPSPTNSRLHEKMEENDI